LADTPGYYAATQGSLADLFQTCVTRARSFVPPNCTNLCRFCLAARPKWTIAPAAPAAASGVNALSSSLEYSEYEERYKYINVYMYIRIHEYIYTHIHK